MDDETLFAKLVNALVFVAICLVIVLVGWREPLRYRFMSAEDIAAEHPPPPPPPPPEPPPNVMEWHPEGNPLNRGPLQSGPGGCHHKPRAASHGADDSIRAERGSETHRPLTTFAEFGLSPSGTKQFRIARKVFAHALGAILFCAFVSFACQARGLIGKDGITPAADFLRRAHEQLDPGAMWQLPTLCWLNAGDASLLAQSIAGALFALILACGFFPGACALICWLLYLSLSTVASPFLDFQWDTLLLETAFLAAFFLPWNLRPDWLRESAVTFLARLLLWWLLFRLIFESGVVKLSSGDPPWRAGTALEYHFETQPLPLWPAWFAHQLPKSLLKASTWAMFSLELIAPMLIFAPRWFRHIAAWGSIALQVLILITGNYAFFNWLTIALCILLFDDRAWPQRLAIRSRVATSHIPAPTGSTWRAALFAPLAAAIFFITACGLISTFRVELPFHALQGIVAPFRTFNTYGLFAVMTTSRPEILIEGSDDGQIWREYEFKWKPGDVRARPRWAAPHQPRLDWQMWFAALGDVRSNPWFVQFLGRLLQGSPEVLALLQSNPFRDAPPRYVRAVLYDYHFTRNGEGPAWWRRQPTGLYCPPLALQDRQPR
jgi:hypothetical protein